MESDRLVEMAEELRALALAASPDVRNEIINVAVNMSQPPSDIEKAIGRLANKGLVTVGVLPPPKGERARDFVSFPQILFKSSAFGDDSDRALTSFKVALPLKVLERYVEYMKLTVGWNDDEP